jgi:hypothetical protein
MRERHKADSAEKLQVKDRPPAGRAIKLRYAEVNGIKIAFDIRASPGHPWYSSWVIVSTRAHGRSTLREIPITLLDRS